MRNILKQQYIFLRVSNCSNLESWQMLSRKQTFYQYIETNLSSSGILSSEQISGILNIYSGPCPTSSKSERQKYYRVRKTYIVEHLLNTRYLYRNESPTSLRVIAKEELLYGKSTQMVGNIQDEIDYSSINDQCASYSWILSGNIITTIVYRDIVYPGAQHRVAVRMKFHTV